MSFSCITKRSVFILLARSVLPVPVIIHQIPFLLEGEHLLSRVVEQVLETLDDHAHVALLERLLQSFPDVVFVEATEDEFL